MECNPEFTIIKPVESYNYVLNPSAETTGNYGAFGLSTISRVTTYHKYGIYSYYVQQGPSNRGVQLTTTALSSDAYYVTVRVRKPYGTIYLALNLGNPNYTTKEALYIKSIDNNWDILGAIFSAAEAVNSTTLIVKSPLPGNIDFYLDGVQVEPLAYPTTYIDGTQAGCRWLGTAHGSRSQRSGLSRAGGQMLDLMTEYGFFVERIIGGNNTTVTVNTDNYAILPGGELNGVKENIRNFSLVGRFHADSKGELHQNRQDLVELLSDATYPNSQPLRLRYGGSAVEKEIQVYYNGGLEGDMPIIYSDDYTIDGDSWVQHSRFTEVAAIQFISPSPYWVEVGESASALDVEDSDTFSRISGRLQSSGQWNNLDSDLGTNGNIFDLKINDGNFLYAGGAFTTIGGNAANRIASWDGSSWAALGSGMNGIVNALVIAPDGTLYAGGLFTTAGGGAANYIASWNGSSWSALGSGMNNSISALAIGLDGTLYAGGYFTTAGGGAANYIASWDGSSWSALGSGMNGSVDALAVGLDGTLYAGGQFTTSGGTTTNRIASWDGSSWAALGSGISAGVPVYDLAIGPDDTLYIGGAFTSIGGITANYIASWNGSSWAALGSGMNNPVYELRITPDGDLYAGGSFTTAGGVDLVNRVARWNGSTWAHLDIEFSATSEAIEYKKYFSGFDLFVAFSNTGTTNYAGLVTVNNDSNTIIYPIITFNRSGGTSATIATLRNETTGKELLFDYGLLDGETLTIDLTPTEKSIISSFFGPRLDAVLPNSDFGEWALMPGNNDITSFVINDGATITATIQWRNQYKGID